MADDGSKVFHNYAYVEASLDIEVIEILPFERYRRVDWLLEDLYTPLDPPIGS